MRTEARSLSQFVQRVRTDPVLQKRYGKHLGLAWQSVPGYLAARLRAERLSKAGDYTVYNVTRDGAIYPTKQRLPAGTRTYRLGKGGVFFTALGDPARPFFKPVLPKIVPVPPPPAPAPVEQVQQIHVPSD